MSSSRLLIVSNRLPVTVEVGGAEVRVAPSAGGLATGLRGPHEKSDGLWIGWPGDVSGLGDEQRAALDRDLAALRTVPLYLDATEATRFYEGYSNGVLWPLFHYLIDRLPLESRDWEVYLATNRRFAELTVEHYRPGDTIWVQDYQLMLVPGMLRERLPDATIGFFLHIPFPSSETFRILARREEILAGMLGADLIGFHTFPYLDHFTRSLLRLLGVEAEVDRVRYGGRNVQLGVFPMGIDAAHFAAVAEGTDVTNELAAMREKGGGRRMLLGVDRLDYTKGLPHRLLAFERLLERDADLRGRVQLVQVAVPSRTHVEAYVKLREQVDAMVGRINGAFGTVDWTPIQYLYRAIPEAQMVALYRAADVMLVTPVRDGLNLVAKEFVASRVDDDGALVLSEFAGVAAELGEALHVNPYDIDATADAMAQALAMDPEERKTRMSALRRRILEHDVHQWAAAFLSGLAEAAAGREPADVRPSSAAEVDALLAKLRAAPSLTLLLDYDGTLMPFARTPERAAPDEALLRLLEALARRPDTHVHIVSGRTRESLERWLGHLPLALHAEHGLWSRAEPGAAWRKCIEPPLEWKQRVRPILELFTSRTPGTRIDEKTASLAWHYRRADPAFCAKQARELRLHLTGLLSNAPVEVLQGNKVLELRVQGVNKGAVVASALARGDALVLAMGDDATDEDLFAALPPDAFAVHVGAGDSRATYRLPSPEAARRLLRALLA